MEPTTITLHSQFRIGTVDARIFGGFLEHMGRAVYQGVYDPDCPAANSFEQPDVVVSRPFADANVDVKVAESGVSLELLPLSVAAMTFVIG